MKNSVIRLVTGQALFGEMLMALGQTLNLSKPEHSCENYTNFIVKTFTLSKSHGRVSYILG